MKVSFPRPGSFSAGLLGGMVAVVITGGGGIYLATHTTGSSASIKTPAATEQPTARVLPTASPTATASAAATQVPSTLAPRPPKPTAAPTPALPPIPGADLIAVAENVYIPGPVCATSSNSCGPQCPSSAVAPTCVVMGTCANEANVGNVYSTCPFTPAFLQHAQLVAPAGKYTINGYLCHCQEPNENPINPQYTVTAASSSGGTVSVTADWSPTHLYSLTIVSQNGVLLVDNITDVGHPLDCNCTPFDPGY